MAQFRHREESDFYSASMASLRSSGRMTRPGQASMPSSPSGATGSGWPPSSERSMGSGYRLVDEARHCSAGRWPRFCKVYSWKVPAQTPTCSHLEVLLAAKPTLPRMADKRSVQRWKLHCACEIRRRKAGRGGQHSRDSIARPPLPSALPISHKPYARLTGLAAALTHLQPRNPLPEAKPRRPAGRRHRMCIHRDLSRSESGIRQ